MKKGTRPKQNRPQQNFAAMVAVEVQRQVNGAIQREVRSLESRLQQIIFQITRFNAIRMKALEDYFTQKDNLSADFFDNLALHTEDKLDGYLATEEAVVMGDRVRFSIKDVNNEKDAEQLKLDSINTDPAQLNKTIESQIVGMKAGEKKTIEAEISEKKFTYEVVVKLVSKKLPDDEKK